MVTWVDNLSEWNRTLPAVLIMVGAGAGERSTAATTLVARALGVPAAAVAIERPKDHRPTIAEPKASGLHLSAATRGRASAVAVARSPIGVDVELVDTAGEIPWNVLHEDESALLRRLQGGERAAAFARLWSLKEAYLKALGLGLSREPSSFAVAFAGPDTGRVSDPAHAPRSVRAQTTWRSAAGVPAAVSAVVLDD
jgi:phosphopantetheinyl transferase